MPGLSAQIPAWGKVHVAPTAQGGGGELPLAISNTPMSDISNTPVTSRNRKVPKAHIKETVYILGI